MDPKHDYGHTAMALAEVQTALGDGVGIAKPGEFVLAHHSYARAKVQFAELLPAGVRWSARVGNSTRWSRTTSSRRSFNGNGRRYG